MSDIFEQATSTEHEELLKKEKAKKLWQTMKPHERLEHYAKEKEADPYAKSKMHIAFPDIRAVKHFNGFILIIVDEKQAFERAVRNAADSLGPEATTTEIITEARRRAIKTKALPLKTFINNLRFITNYTTHSQFYTSMDANKKSELHDIFADSLAAIKEARRYRYTHPDEFRVENVAGGDARFMRGEFPVQPKDFALTFGHNWKSKLGADLVDMLDINIYDDKDSLIMH
jgi:hypothetical protein